MLRLSRFVAVAIILTVIASLVNCSSIVFAITNAPSYIGSFERHADIRYGEESRQALDVYVPTNAANRPVVVFWYGGMWTRGSKEQYRFVGAALAKSGYVAVLPDYRLYPSARFPQFIEDGALALKWVRQHAGELGGDANAIFLMGHSAGAHIASSLALDSRYLRKVGGSREWVRGWIGLSGPYALERPIPILKDMFRAPYDTQDWQVIALVKERSSPALILHGTEDYLVHPRDAVALDRLLRAAGTHVECHLYPSTSHMGTVAAFSIPMRPLSTSLADVRDFIDRTVKATDQTGVDGGLPCPELRLRRDGPVF
jgi:acetyl esterase/lipase